MMALAFERIMPTALVTSVSHVVDHDETPMGSYYPMQNVQAAAAAAAAGVATSYYRPYGDAATPIGDADWSPASYYPNSFSRTNR